MINEKNRGAAKPRQQNRVNPKARTRYHSSVVGQGAADALGESYLLLPEARVLKWKEARERTILVQDGHIGATMGALASQSEGVGEEGPLEVRCLRHEDPPSLPLRSVQLGRPLD